MQLKKLKKNKTEQVAARCTADILNRLQCKANIYTEGNLSAYILFAGLNFVPRAEDFEDEKAPSEEEALMAVPNPSMD